MDKIFKKYWWLFLILILFLLLLLLLVFKMGNSGSIKQLDDLETTLSNESTSSAQEATKSSKENDEDYLKKAVSVRTGILLDKMDYKVSKNTGEYAKGLISTKGEMFGGGYWLAVKSNGKWEIIFDGQNTPECVLVDLPEFPADMVPECLDSLGQVVVRT